MNTPAHDTPRFSPAEKRRFIALVALLLVVTAALWARRKDALRPESSMVPPSAAALPELSGMVDGAGGPPLAGVMDPDPVEPYVWNRAEAFADVKDGSDAFPPKAFAFVLHACRAASADDKGRASAPRLTARELRARSGELRGGWVEVVGAVHAGLYAPEQVPWSGPTGVYRVYANFVFDAEGGAIKVYSVRDAPPLGAGDVVAARGVYLQTLSYRNREGGTAVAPIVITERILRFEPPPRVTWLTAYAIPGGLAAAALALLVVGLRAPARSQAAGSNRGA